MNTLGHDEIALDSAGSEQEPEDSTGGSYEGLLTEHPGRLDTASMSVSSLFANLFTNSADGLGFLPEGDSQSYVEGIKANHNLQTLPLLDQVEFQQLPKHPRFLPPVPTLRNFHYSSLTHPLKSLETDPSRSKYLPLPLPRYWLEISLLRRKVLLLPLFHSHPLGLMTKNLRR
jgi:hypothetical protein